MADLPFAFRTSMVRALLAGWKTQHRVLLRPRRRKPPKRMPETWEEAMLHNPWFIDDYIWVQEAWQAGPPALPSGAGIMLPSTPMPGHKVIYRADGDDYVPKVPWRSPIFMPRWASRLTLSIKDLRVERLQEIDEEGIRAEGIPDHITEQAFCKRYRDDKVRAAKRLDYFKGEWERRYGHASWDANPWVVVLIFTVGHHNIDEIDQ